MDKDVDKRVAWLHSEQSSAAGNIFGEPQKTTRVGDECQAQIPPLMTENERSQLMKVPVCEFGLSSLVTWVRSRHNNTETNAKGYETDNKGMPNVPCLSSEQSWSVIEERNLKQLQIQRKELSLKMADMRQKNEHIHTTAGAQPSSGSLKRSSSQRGSVSYIPSPRSTLPKAMEMEIQAALDDLLEKGLLTIADISFAQRYLTDSTWASTSFIKPSPAVMCSMILEARDAEEARKRKRIA